MHERVAMLILMPAIVVSSAHAQPPRDFQSTTANGARFPYEEIAGHLFVRGTIGDSGPLWFTLDTGASLSLLDAGCAESLGVPLTPGRTITGAGGQVTGEMAKGVVIRLAGVEVRDLVLDVSSLDMVKQALGHDVDLVLGYELWSRFIVEIDPIAKEICLHDPATWTYRGTGEAIPITLQENCPYVKLQLQLPEVGVVDVECILDTGSGNTLILQSAFVDEHRLRDRVGKTLPLRAGGVGGQFGMSLCRLPSLQIGRFEIERPLVLLAQEGDFAAPGSAGNIGCGLLRRFRTIFDYPHGRMILEPNERFAVPDEHDMCGAGLLPDDQEPGGFSIMRVREGSPAAGAGLRVGDRLVAIDDNPASELGLERIHVLFRDDGRERVLRIRRDGELLEVRVKLRRMI